MKLLKLVLVFLFPLVGFSQVAQRSSTAILPSGSAGNFAQLVPFASVYVCVYNAQTQCTTPLPVYADIGLLRIIPQPVIADSSGVYSYFVPSGTQLVEKVCSPFNQCSSTSLLVGDGGSSPIIGSGSGYSIPAYPLAAGTILNPSNIKTDSNGNNLFVPGFLSVTGTIQSNSVSTVASTSAICPNGIGGAFTTVGCNISTGSVSGLTTGWIPIATGPSSITAISHINELTAGVTKVTQPLTASVDKELSVLAPPYNAKVDGVTDDTAAWVAACTDALTQNATLTMPTGTSLVSQEICVINHPTKIRGEGAGLSIISFSGSAPIPAAFDIENTSNVEISGISIVGAAIANGLTTGVIIQNSQHINLHDMNIAGGGYGTGANPRTQIYVEHSDDVMLNTIHLSNAGGIYGIVTNYRGQISTRIHERNITEDNNLAVISFSNFNLASSDTLGSTIDENNTTNSTVAAGYGVMYYANSTTFSLTAGCTGAGTITCTVPLLGGVTQLPYTASFRVEILGVTGGTGAINGTWDAVLLSPTTFSYVSPGSDTSLPLLTPANFSVAMIYYPNTDNIIADNHIKNTAGSGIYCQGCQYTVIGNNTIENTAQQQLATILPVGGIAINSGYTPAPLSQGMVLVGNIIQGSGQNGIEAANTQDLSLIGGHISNIPTTGTSGIFMDGGSFNNYNWNIAGGVTIDNTYHCINVNGINVNGTIGAVTCSNSSNGALFLQSGGVVVGGPVTINGSTTAYTPCIDDFYANNVYSNVTCNSGFNLIAGTGTKLTNVGVQNTPNFSSKAAWVLQGAAHIIIQDAWIDNAPSGFLFVNGTVQSNDIWIKNPHMTNLTNGAFADLNPAAVTGSVSVGSSSVTLTTSAAVSIGMGIADYAGSNYIPTGTTILNVVGTCSTGCSVTMSANATNSNATDSIFIQQSMPFNIHLWDADIEGTGTDIQPAILSYGFQGLDIQEGNINGFITGADIDLRGQTNGVTISDVNVSEASNLAAVNLYGGIFGSAQNVVVNNLTTSGIGTYSIQDLTSSLGNSYIGTTGLNLPTNITNTNAIISAFAGATSGNGAPSSGACTKSLLNLIYNQNDAPYGQNQWTCIKISGIPTWVNQSGADSHTPTLVFTSPAAGSLLPGSNDQAGEISITTGNGVGGGLIVTVNFGGTYLFTKFCVFSNVAGNFLVPLFLNTGSSLTNFQLLSPVGSASGIGTISYLCHS